ncbi:hypothetical protein EVAR_40006_1 [Eumeta japonica]|uniref:Uncharacterized protein n=1 Tax=Eumeta variegata TaxID=151549 RepID=A0A4C1ZN70_EUMVA|nr:hypothetical protein EVAR_40006_1 [Eumeta japonica]
MMTGLGSSAIKGDFDPYQDSDPFGPQRFDIGINHQQLAAGASASTERERKQPHAKGRGAVRQSHLSGAARRPCTHRPVRARTSPRPRPAPRTPDTPFIPTTYDYSTQ